MKDFMDTFSELISLIFNGKLSALEIIGVALVLLAMAVFLHFFLKIITMDPNTKISLTNIFKRKRGKKTEEKES